MNIIVNYYSLSGNGLVLDHSQETFTGSDCSGSSGDANRALTLSNTQLTKQAGFSVYVSGLYLTNNVEYSVEHKTAGTVITFLNPIWNSMDIVINYFQTSERDYSLIRSDFQEIIITHGQNFTLKRNVEDVDTMGGVSTTTTESYNVVSMIMGITMKDRQIHEMGLAVPGNVKALFFHEYPDSITGNGPLQVQVGDILEESGGKQWRIESIPGEKIADEHEIYRTAVLRNLNLEE